MKILEGCNYPKCSCTPPSCSERNQAPFRLQEGWFCLVHGVRHGPWPDKGSATAGFETEKRRWKISNA